MARSRPKDRRPRSADLPARLAALENPAIAYFARRDLLDEDAGPVSALWELKEARRIVARQNLDGSWRYPGAQARIRSQENYDQIETFRQVAILVEMFGFAREHPALARAAEYLFSCQTREGDFRGIYGHQYATTYAGAIMELLIKAGYADDPRVAKGFAWLLSARQDDGGWAVPLRTARVPYSESVDVDRYPTPIVPVTSRPSSHLATGMVLRAFAAHPSLRKSGEARRAATWFVSRLYRRDAYPDRGDPAYWERVSFPFWFTDIVTALDTLSRMEWGMEPAIASAIDRLRRRRRQDGTLLLKIVRGKLPDLPWWICLAVCRSCRRWGVRF
jgi:hypothetical protein